MLLVRIDDGASFFDVFVLRQENLEPILTTVGSVAFLAINLWYMVHLLRRPYASPPPTPALGDPFNDAETLGIRVVSLGAVLIAAYGCLSELEFSKDWIEDPNNSWVLDLICAGVLVALVYSQLKLFKGIWANFFSDDDSGERERINLLLKADAVRMAIFLQDNLDNEGMHIKEADRWIGKPRQSRANPHIVVAWSLRTLYILLVVFPAVLVFAASLFSLVVAMMSNPIAWRVIAFLPLTIFSAMEVMVWKSRRVFQEVAEICESASQSAIKSANESATKSAIESLREEEFGVSQNPITATL
mmetsp:Transcript_19568/g.40570  ORF Transcript_19568/g.40570 Transcript_19568/m.40570 type:complete len:302 (+) Transcript_19568:286-1191(+)